MFDYEKSLNPLTNSKLNQNSTINISANNQNSSINNLLKQFLEDDTDLDSFDDEYIQEIPQFYSGGVGRSEYTNCHVIPKITEKSILPDLLKINIPDDIRNEAEKIFQQLKTNTKRGKRRKKMLFYCIFNAYKSLGQPQDPKVIAELVGISATEITKALSMCSESQTNYRPIAVFRQPLDFIPIYHSEVGLNPDCLSSVLELAHSILNKDPDLYDEYPQVVAAGILHYYMTINGVSVDKKQFAKIFKKSEMTITKMFKRICNIDNSK